MPSEESLVQDLRELETELRDNGRHREANSIDLYIKTATNCKIKKPDLDSYITNRISSIDKLLDDMIDKSIGCINVTGLTKKEKEEVITKRNSLLVQKATIMQLKEDLLPGVI